jgi:hypothetical protein
MRKNRSKTALQFCVAIGACVPVAAGAAGVLFGPGMVDPDYGGSLMIGLIFWSLIPDIEKRGVEARLLTALVVIGGLGRLWAAVAEGPPGLPMTLALVMELIVTPALAWWQYRLARRMGHD